MLKCLVCYSELPPPVQVKSEDEIKTGHESDGDGSCPSIQKTLHSKHLDVIFILRNIFQVPVPQLSNYLKNCPKVDNWICICEKCTELVRGYQAIYNDLLDISRKVEQAKLGIIRIIKNSYQGDDEPRSESQNNRAFFNITDECRRFIKDHEYRWPFNPFTDGDLKALQLLDKQNSVSKDDKPLPISNNFRTRSKTKRDLFLTTTSNTSTYSYPDNDEDFEPSVGDFNSDDSEDDDEEDGPTKIIPKDKPEEGKLSKHHKYKKPGGQFECPHCPSKKYAYKATLILHFKNKHPDCTPPPKCKGGRQRKYPLLDFYTVSKSRKRHFKLKSKVQGQCPQCGKQFKNLKHHIEFKHLRKYDYHCANCGLRRSCRKSLESHEALCSAEGPKEKCPEKDCPVTVSLKMGLETHFRDKHSERSLFSSCPVCQEGFYTELALEWHIKRRHKDTKPFKCDQCEVGLYSSQTLKSHKRRYHDEGGGMAKMICELCGAKFSNQRYLTEHVKMQHEDEYKLRCEQCGRGYSTEELLKVHLFLKHGVGRVEDMRWRCGVEGCGKVFWKKGPLDLHLSLHHEEGVGGKCAEWTCEECGKQFYLKYQLAHHRKRFHESNLDEKFKCDICGVEFKFNYYVTRHKKKVHKIIPQKRR